MMAEVQPSTDLAGSRHAALDIEAAPATYLGGQHRARAARCTAVVAACLVAVAIVAAYGPLLRAVSRADAPEAGGHLPVAHPMAFGLVPPELRHGKAPQPVPQVRPAPPVSEPGRVMRQPFMVQPDDDATRDSEPGFQTTPVRPLFVDANSVMQKWKAQVLALHRAKGLPVSDSSRLQSMEKSLSILSHQEADMNSGLTKTQLSASVFGLIWNMRDQVEDVLAMAVVRVWRLRESSSAVFSDIEAALKQFRTHRSTDLNSVSVVEITDIEQAPILGRHTEMIHMDELVRRIVRWSLIQGFLVVFTPEKREMRARYELIGFKSCWIDGIWRMIYDGKAPNYESARTREAKEMVDLSLATELGRRQRQYREQIVEQSAAPAGFEWGGTY